jgi:hypothetical protein
MSVPTSAKTVTFTFTEDEATAYYDLIAARQRWGAQSGHGRASLVYVPLALGALLMAVSVLRGGRGNADFGLMFVVGTIAYMAGHFAVNYEYMRQYKLQYKLQRTAQLSELLFHGARHVTLKQAALEWSVPNVTTQIGYAAFTDVEIAQEFILGWIGSADPAAIPVRAFASASEAEAFANDMRSRINAARSA